MDTPGTKRDAHAKSGYGGGMDTIIDDVQDLAEIAQIVQELQQPTYYAPTPLTVTQMSIGISSN